ncbi:MAG: outer membrane beta-barrel protein, partial [Bacteroidota bacterium]
RGRRGAHRRHAGGGAPPAGMNNGRFYGKVVDENGKGVGYATVQLFGNQFDPATKTLKEGLISGQITEDNGDFNLENLPVVGDFKLKISFIGYAEIEQTVTFGIKPPTPGASGGSPSGAGGGAGFGGSKEKDLGNIKLVAETQSLETVEVTAERAVTTLALDSKVYRVDKDASAAGGNATDALKNVPSLSVDLDGNVSLRNGSPQIFVDGRPTTLSLDQIAADAIESVEVITNPSAKYDAGGGTAGIINIVLKKEKRLGYNGSVRFGGDSNGGFNGGGDVNARGEKTNLFVSGNLNRMHGNSNGETTRQNLTGDPLTNFTQSLDNSMNGYFANARGGMDWFVDNRNTLTFSGNFTRGSFNPLDVITTRTDSLFQSGIASSQYERTADQERNFRNIGTSLQFKHLFPKEGAEWTADVNYNRVRFLGSADYTTNYDSGSQSLEENEGRGRGQFVTFQSDFVNPIAPGMKLEGGVRGAMRRNRNDTKNEFFNQDGTWEEASSLADHYKFRDDVFAAYGTFSHQFPTWGYQIGLRAESSIYTGALTDGSDSSFTIAYPIDLFPSAFLTKKLNETDQVQLAYTRRINRPNFFQTMPFTDFADSLNLRRGNPKLRPEFTNSLELSYQNIFARNHNLLISIYYKQVSDLITTYLAEEFNEDLGKNVVVATYANSNSSQAYGAEMTLKNSFAK